MNLRGEYILTFSDGTQKVIPNTIVAEGAEDMLLEIFQNAGLGSFYMGLCHQVPDNGDIHADITTEPTVGVNNYARGVLARNSTDWPTVATANNESYMESKAVVFTASGGAFDAPFSRLFLCSTATGFAGVLFSYSAALASAITLASGDSFTAQYRFYLS